MKVCGKERGCVKVVVKLVVKLWEGIRLCKSCGKLRHERYFEQIKEAFHSFCIGVGLSIAFP